MQLDMTRYIERHEGYHCTQKREVRRLRGSAVKERLYLSNAARGRDARKVNQVAAVKVADPNEDSHSREFRNRRCIKELKQRSWPSSLGAHVQEVRWETFRGNVLRKRIQQTYIP
jgi:hypothetical protein